jgi:leucyl aminopeptidase
MVLSLPFPLKGEYLIKIPYPLEKQQEIEKMNLNLRYVGKDFCLFSASAELMVKIPDTYTILGSYSEEEEIFFVWVKKPEDLGVIRKYGQVLYFFNQTAIIKGKIEEIIKLSEQGFKLKLLPERIPWSEQVKYFTPAIRFKSSAEETADTQIIKEILQNFTTTQYVEYIQYLQGLETRYSFSPKIQETKDYLVNKFQEFGLSVSTFPFALKYNNQDYTLYNVIATLSGETTPKKEYILCAHYDSTVDNPYDPMVSAPGADDNASGISALLLAAKYLSQKKFNSTIKFVCFAGEEQGMKGSQSYAKEMYNQGVQILGTINLDMIAWWKPGIKYDLNIITNTKSQWLSDYLTQISTKYVSMPLDRMTNDNAWWGDHSSFWDYGYTAVMTFEAYPPWSGSDFNLYYHTPEDTLDKLDLDFALKNTKTCIATVCELADPYNLPTKITLLEPDGKNDTVKWGEKYNILWSGTTNQISLSYAPGIDGEKNPIVTCDGSLEKYEWDTSSTPQGEYYIYAKDEVNGDSDWSSGPLTVLAGELRVYVYPNPYYPFKDNQLIFVGLPDYAQLRIYSLTGELLFEREIYSQFRWSWEGKNENNEKVASGIYIYTVTDGNNQQTKGKIAILK